MTDFYLIRHGATDAIGHSFTGRLPGVSLNEQGRAQASALARHFAPRRLDCVQSSPSERAVETAHLVAAAHGLAVSANPAFAEIDVGRWSGRSFEGLVSDPGFQLFNSARSLTRPPGGELMLEVQTRAASELLRIAREEPDHAIAVVCHADVIKAALAYFLGIPLDLAYRMEIDLCSISELRLSIRQVQVVAINRVVTES